jgi:hypothetical protein
VRYRWLTLATNTVLREQAPQPTRSRGAPLRQLRRAAVSGRRSALRGRFFSVAGQVRNLTWSPSLLARSWHLSRRPANGSAPQSPQRASAQMTTEMGAAMREPRADVSRSGPLWSRPPALGGKAKRSESGGGLLTGVVGGVARSLTP